MKKNTTIMQFLFVIKHQVGITGNIELRTENPNLHEVCRKSICM